MQRLLIRVAFGSLMFSVGAYCAGDRHLANVGLGVSLAFSCVGVIHNARASR